MATLQELMRQMLAGEPLALARLITRIEKEGAEAVEVLREASQHAGRGYRIGFTGPPGSGKSTIVDQLTATIRGEGQGRPTVGIIAVDPSSPFTGGALLGDRIRMEQHYKDPGVYIRSMGSRGSHGGLPHVTQRVATLLEASGKDYILIETVGVGQTELDVMEVADTVVVVLVPEAGDTIQTMKAGLMEIADVFVVNKADRDGADRLAREVEQSLHLSARVSEWTPPVLLTKAARGEGIQELREAIGKHREYAERSGELARRRQRRRTTQFLTTVEEKVSAALRELIEGNGDLKGVLERVQSGEVDPYSAAIDVVSNRDILHKWASALEKRQLR
ncbi:MAG: methylmalonyl Co-A mutase-associated GTPase MeaB [Chloroflexi bacterium]|nr:methylmalonyl Co-A mutase-associated GTPase MeaB [Chloroflexota bacterium]